eukprot:363740-Chlamydomonas_euryale.AAC.24
MSVGCNCRDPCHERIQQSRDTGVRSPPAAAMADASSASASACCFSVGASINPATEIDDRQSGHAAFDRSTTLSMHVRQNT